MAADQKQALEVRSHVLTLREGELDSRLRDRERTVNALEEQLREITTLLRKGEATRDAQTRRILALEEQLLAQAKESRRPESPARPPVTPRRQTAKRPAVKRRARVVSALARKTVADKSKKAKKTAAVRQATKRRRR
jgi:hypothetical protein